MSRKKNENEESKGKFYTLVQHIAVNSFKELLTENTNLKK